MNDIEYIAYLKGANDKQNNIIKLLERDMCLDWKEQVPLCCDGACSAYNDAINLIKGANK